MIAVAVRLPFILSETNAPDADECVLGLMAKHALDGKGMPVFFWGQRYGFSAVEVTVASLSFRLFGMSDTSLKSAMLCLWVGALTVMGLAVRRGMGERAGILTMLLLAFCPAWFAWSMKARGGYLTAFLLTSISVYLVYIALGSSRFRPVLSLAMGALASVVCFSQPFWLLVLGPMLFYFLVKSRRLSSVLGILCGAGATLFLLHLAVDFDAAPYHNPPVFANAEVWRALSRLPGRVRTALSGSYYFQARVRPGPWTLLASRTWCALLLLGLLMSVLSCLRRNLLCVVNACALGIVAILSSTLFMNHSVFGYRYLLPLAGALVLLLSAGFAQWKPARRSGDGLAFLIAGLIAVIGVGTALESSRVTQPKSRLCFSNRKVARRLVERLSEQGIHHVYCMDPMFQWNITFASKERVTARWIDLADRMPAYAAKVDEALASGQPVALVGCATQVEEVENHLRMHHPVPLGPEMVRGGFFILYDPPKTLLLALGFRLHRSTPVEESGPGTSESVRAQSPSHVPLS